MLMNETAGVEVEADASWRGKLPWEVPRRVSFLWRGKKQMRNDGRDNKQTIQDKAHEWRRNSPEYPGETHQE